MGRQGSRPSGFTNPLAAALHERRFCYVVELVASRLTREARLLDVAARLARLPDIAAASITGYAGGAMGHDPLRVGTAARARGLTPNIHLTCVSQDRRALRKSLDDLHALGISNVFALTGDYPQGAGAAGAAPAVFDLDSVQLVRLISEMRSSGKAFHISVAVSPFKYVESDCLWQYIKLAKKIEAGADLAITQVGWDARKFAELKRWLDERGLSIPLLGNVYVLGPKTAERMATGQPPGCWVSPELLEVVRRESAGKDGGLRARLERAARTVAVLHGLGYAGAYIGGTHEPEHVAWIMRRANDLFAQGGELAEELSFGARGGFYVYPTPGMERSLLPLPPAEVGGVVPRALDTLARVFPVSRDTWMRRSLARLFRWIDRRPVLARGVERVELAIKKPVFGCEACGNCVLSWLQYVCPQTCPKQMRNGPCGGTHLGRCEVVDQPCIWVAVWERATVAERTESLKVYVPPPDRSLQGTSSWINYFLDRDSRPRSGPA